MAGGQAGDEVGGREVFLHTPGRVFCRHSSSDLCLRLCFSPCLRPDVAKKNSCEWQLSRHDHEPRNGATRMSSRHGWQRQEDEDIDKCPTNHNCSTHALQPKNCLCGSARVDQYIAVLNWSKRCMREPLAECPHQPVTRSGPAKVSPHQTRTKKNCETPSL